MSDFWKAVGTPRGPLTVEDLDRGAEAIIRRDQQEPVHVIRGDNWCDQCGWRSLGMWRHGDPRDKAKSDA